MTDSPIVQKRLTRWLSPILREERFLNSEEDPTLSDLIWWKRDRVVVVEVSIKVNGQDVIRACSRAAILRSVGVNVLPVVIGEDWANLEARELARERGVEWMIGGTPSDGLIAFRRLPSDEH